MPMIDVYAAAGTFPDFAHARARSSTALLHNCSTFRRLSWQLPRRGQARTGRLGVAPPVGKTRASAVQVEAGRRGDVAELMTEVNGVELCTESFGDPSDPAVLLVMGVGASMLWWEDGFCKLLAAR